MTTVTVALQKIQTIYDNAKSTKVERVRHMTDKTFPVGASGRQGDIYIHRVSADHAHGQQTKNYQLAFGNTQGSRHVAMGEGVKVYTGTRAPAYCDSKTFLGPFIEATQEFTIYHPEHAHIKLPAGFYQITHQMDLASQLRVKD